MPQDAKILELQKKIKIKFENKDLLKEALTHRSYLNENPKWSPSHNERLEYLGDAVLELVVSEHLFKEFPTRPEGGLTSIRAALVNHLMLSRVADELELEKFIRLSKGEAKDTGRAKEAILADAVEALIGAIYLDQQYDIAKKFIEEHILKHQKDVIENELFIDSKSLLQEIVQEKLKETPTYQVLEETGPDHKKEFIVGVFFNKKVAAKGKGLSKQEAERDAATNALKKLEK